MRILYGARISLFVGVVTTVIGTVAGVAVGLDGGVLRRHDRQALSRFVDAVLAFPDIVLGLALAIVYGPSLPMVIGVISFFVWAGIARVVRGQTISIKEREYIEAARSIGSGPWRIMFIDILPNLLGPVLVLATLAIPSAIVFEATLSFLGLGVPPPEASWGNILAGAQNYYSVAWSVPGLPGARAADHHAGVQPARRRHPGRNGPGAARLLDGTEARTSPLPPPRRRGTGSGSAPGPHKQFECSYSSAARLPCHPCPRRGGSRPWRARLARSPRGWPPVLSFLIRRSWRAS